jgi:type I restriction enzyme M protein
VLIGSTIQSVSVSDLMQIKINVPSIEEQKAKVDGIKQAFLESKKRELAYQQQLLGLTDESFREFASIKHTFRQYLNALKSNVAGTKLFVQNNHEKGITLDTIYSKNLNKSFGEHLLGLEGTISSMSKLLSSFETSNEDTLAKEHDLLELVEEAQNRFKNPELFQFEKVYFDENSFAFGEDYRAPIIAIDEDDFYRIFSNIISNAIDHGFKDVTKEYRIRTEISFDEKERMCILEVSNNGNAMPKDFTLKDLTTRGEKTTDSKGSGMGGADIKNILKKYDGKLEISNMETEEFTVTYRISLPLFTVTL